METINIIAALAILIFGVPHGALDPLTAHRLGLIPSKVKISLFMIGYLAIASIAFYLWLIFPLFSLTIFLVISVYHFGSDWDSKKVIDNIAYGFFVLGLPAQINPEQVETVFNYLLQGSDVGSLIFALTTCFLFSCAWLVLKIPTTKVIRIFELILLAGMALLFDPIIYFTFFFCLLHSPRHFTHELKLIASHNLWVVLVVVLGIMALTVILGLIMGQTLSLKISYSNDLLALIFIGVACLTYPHVLLIEYGKLQNI